MKDNLFIEETQTIENDYITDRNKPMPSRNHGRIQSNINYLIKLNYKKKYISYSELSLELEGLSVVPDIAIFNWTKYEATNDEIRVTEPPLCTMEILSPKQNQSDLLLKTRQYFQKGVKSVWIVFPELQNVYIFSSETDYEMYRKGQILKDKKMGIELNVEEIFE